MKTYRSTILKAAVAAILLASSLPVAAQVKGVIIKTTGQQIPGRSIRWQGISKVYVVDTGQVQLKVPLSEVKQVRVAKPAALDKAITDVNSGRYRTAIPALQEIVKTYQMMEWDLVAAQYLGKAQLRSGNADEAVKACETVLAQNPTAGQDPSFAGVYWESLMEADRTAKLKQVLTEIIQTGESRGLMAVAHVRRGDLLSKQGEHRKALVDGYLRTVVLFQSEASARPEALYKATKAFEALNELPNAERMRKSLLAEFPNNEYTSRLKSGA